MPLCINEMRDPTSACYTSEEIVIEYNKMSKNAERQDSNGSSSDESFPRIPSESSLAHKIAEHRPSKPWERSQSALDLKSRYRSQSVDYLDTSSTTSSSTTANGGKVSEHSRVYWDLSKGDEDMQVQSSSRSGGKFKISLHTIHQKEEMQSNPRVSVQARVVRRMASETSMTPNSVNTEYHEFHLPAPESPKALEDSTPSPTKTEFKFFFNQGKPNLSVTLSKAVPILQENILQLKAESEREQCGALRDMLTMIEQAWATPTIGRDLAYGLCDVLRNDGGLDILIDNCDTSGSYKVKLGSAKVLEQSMTVENRDSVAKKGLEVIVKLAKNSKDDQEMTKVTTGILESLFKHSEETCSKAITIGGLDSILYSCRNMDTITLRHCAGALANLAMFGGAHNQQEMISRKTAEWLFPLAFCNDDSVRYYAFLAIACLSANKELEASVVKSGTLELVKPFITSRDPFEFGQSDKAHIHGQSKYWLQRLLPLLHSGREEAQSLAAFHFAMEAGIKAEQGKLEIFNEIGAVEPLKKLASGTNKLASKFAAQALKIIGETVPYTLSQQAPLWSPTDVQHWLQQAGFGEFSENFNTCQVDGDILLTLTDEELKTDLGMTNGITRKRFMRELTKLKKQVNYESCDPSKLVDWLVETDKDLLQYSYGLLKGGADRNLVRFLNEDHLRSDCCIANGIDRMKIIEAAKRIPATVGQDMTEPLDRPIDVFISYRRSNGAQLASLLKVHLQLRGFTVFLDIEKLRAGKFDDNLLRSVKNARNFILVLTPNSLDRCINDHEQKDWVHKEIAAAIEGGCNIIPVVDSFHWPEPSSLPEDMRPICFFNAIRWIHDYQDACVDKMEKFMTGITPCHVAERRPPLSKGSSLGSIGDLPTANGPRLTKTGSLDSADILN